MKSIFDPVFDVARDVIERAIDDTPGLFQLGNGNWCSSVRDGLSERIVRDLSAQGFLPTDDKLEDATVFGALTYQLGRIPKALLIDVRREFCERPDFLAGPRAEIARRIIVGLETSGYRLTKGHVVAKPHGGNFPGFEGR